MNAVPIIQIYCNTNLFYKMKTMIYQVLSLKYWTLKYLVFKLKFIFNPYFYSSQFHEFVCLLVIENLRVLMIEKKSITN